MFKTLPFFFSPGPAPTSFEITIPGSADKYNSGSVSAGHTVSIVIDPPVRGKRVIVNSASIFGLCEVEAYQSEGYNLTNHFSLFTIKSSFDQTIAHKM